MNEKALELVGLLNKKKLKITCAESCTGGLLSGAITSVSGSSAVFDGAVCSYANRIKHNMLGVSQEVLDTKGAVSYDSAYQMATGVLAMFEADVALSVTGIAGPGGGTAQKPVGTVFIGVAHKSGSYKVEECHFAGDRDTVRAKSVEKALSLAIELVKNRL